ncbi:MAG: S-methyl-5-thioribose-1-phosphate isomerase [Prolixibacteraceae bacterium]|jgi:methylthioribose-1-phosphate isomerase|nr:S-methyl-5-thioribose-1-phosphate isomerase [Prolixibacteraceae bacterium]
MRINGQHFETIWTDRNNKEKIKIIDQQKLPFKFEIKTLTTFDEAYNAIKEMTVRGAPLIGVTAAFGVYLAMLGKVNNEKLADFISLTCSKMKTARPTAVNLAWAVNYLESELQGVKSVVEARILSFNIAVKLKELEIEYSNAIGEHGLQLIEEISKQKKGTPVNILTHCNAGWLACIDWGTATAPVYKAHQKGIGVHVWVDETRPRNQGSKLTAYELAQEGVPHTVIPDNTGSHLMQHGMVDLVLVGSDRTTRTGDVCNKIGTYLKALAARDNNIPFYVALPSSSIDFKLSDGIKEIPIEQRDGDEVRFALGKEGKTQLVPSDSPVANYGFDVTPARLVSGLITERGICEANEEAIKKMFGK